MGLIRDKQLKLRVTEKELKIIKNKIKKSKLNQNDFLLKSALEKEIVVIEGLPEMTLELKKIGNNLNQLTKLVHQGKVNCKDELSEINEEMKEVWQLLRQLIQKQV
ncbi:MAG: MobC family plasmid mobilization relaxosome protein [Paeniclostridium sordellii]|nr:MobC family plasmid mobilization relaxosome protein [Paeniclostridium sordellii]